MPVGASSIKRAAKTAAAGEPREESLEGKEAKPKSAGQSGKTAKASGKTAQKRRETKAVQGNAPRKASGKAKPADSTTAGQESDARQAYEAYGIGQQLPIHLL